MPNSRARNSASLPALHLRKVELSARAVKLSRWRVIRVGGKLKQVEGPHPPPLPVVGDLHGVPPGRPQPHVTEAGVARRRWA
jgi:hypothetical protein